jgi:predicted HAD superfamily Cof-like phosphohydrolase
MNHSLKQVSEFHQLFEHQIGENSSHEEPLNIRQLRIKLLFEELKELAEASDCKRTFVELCDNYTLDVLDGLGDMEGQKSEREQVLTKLEIHDGDNVNKLEELDALCDIQYVLNGKILTAGLHKVFDREFTVVHQNNMTKAHSSLEHADETLYKTLKDKGTIVEKNGYFIVLNESLKVIKPWDHTKVKLSLEE